MYIILPIQVLLSLPLPFVCVSDLLSLFQENSADVVELCFLDLKPFLAVFSQVLTVHSLTSNTSHCIRYFHSLSPLPAQPKREEKIEYFIVDAQHTISLFLRHLHDPVSNKIDFIQLPSSLPSNFLLLTSFFSQNEELQCLSLSLLRKQQKVSLTKD